MDRVIYFIDIDGTICTDTKGQYNKAEPYRDRIEKINNLYDAGHKVIYWTARGMTRGKGNIHKAYEYCYEITRNQLDEWGVKYHELRLGKPYYDILMDDKAIGI